MTTQPPATAEIEKWLRVQCQAKFMTSHHVRMHRAIFYIPNVAVPF